MTIDVVQTWARSGNAARRHSGHVVPCSAQAALLIDMKDRRGGRTTVRLRLAPPGVERTVRGKATRTDLPPASEAAHAAAQACQYLDAALREGEQSRHSLEYSIEKIEFPKVNLADLFSLGYLYHIPIAPLPSCCTHARQDELLDRDAV